MAAVKTVVYVLWNMVPIHPQFIGVFSSYDKALEWVNKQKSWTEGERASVIIEPCRLDED